MSKHQMKVVRDPSRQRGKTLEWSCSKCGWKWFMGRRQFWKNQVLHLVPNGSFPRCKGTPLRQHYMNGGSL